MMLNEKARQTQDRGSTTGGRSLLRARRSNRFADYSVNCYHRIPVFEGSMKDVSSMNSGSYHSARRSTGLCPRSRSRRGRAWVQHGMISLSTRYRIVNVPISKGAGA